MCPDALCLPGGRAALLATWFLLALAAPSAAAAPLVPGPGESGHDASLAAKAEAYDLQIHALLAVPLGFGLEAFVSDAASRKLIEDFLKSGATDLKTYSGKHPYEVLDMYEEFGDLGIFGGVQAAGDAFRYAVLRDGKAPAAQVARARQALLRAMDGLHWQTQITGTSGIVARGLQRITPETGEPALPGTIPATTPLFDSQGKPLPAAKKPTWRKDASGKLPFLIWIDDCSKDQIDGYVFTLGVIHDVVAGDAAIPKEKVTSLQADALAIGRKLMEPVDVGWGSKIDPVIQDADGRPTTYHDLSAEEVAPGVVWDTAVNGFNALLALSIMRTLYHITGDQALGRYYADELIKKRGYLDATDKTIKLMYLSTVTNYSSVNMAFIAAWGILRYENDPTLAKTARSILEQSLYAPGLERDAANCGQTFFDFIYAGFRDGGSSGKGATAVQEGTRTLLGFPDPPYWNPEVVNCDAQEIASLKCTATDGVTSIELVKGISSPNSQVATKPVPMKLRPPSNFEWRSDPHRVNGGKSDRLNPGGGFHAAYWMGRYLKAAADGMANLSPLARSLPPALTDAGPGDGTAGRDAGTGAAGAGDAGCACHLGLPEGARPAALWLWAGIASLAWVTRRRRSARG